MENHNKSDTFSESDLRALLNSAQNGDRTAEDKLLKAAEPPLLPMVCKWYKADDNDPNVQDAVQGIKLRLIEQLRKRPREIRNPMEYIAKVALNYLRSGGAYAKAQKRDDIKFFKGLTEAAKKERGLKDKQLASCAEDVQFQKEERPDKDYERRENNKIDKIIRQFMNQLPKDLRGGIEKSLDLIVDLFRTRLNLRDKLKRDFKHTRQILKAIGAIDKALMMVSRTCNPAPRDKDLTRLYELREFSGPYVFSGIPEKDKEMDARLAEESDLEKKYGAAYSLFEAKRKLSAKILNPELGLRLTPARLLDPGFLVDYESPWIDHLSEIAGMKVSPLNLIYKIWSRAPGFRKAGSGKYRNRKEIEFALYGYKKTSKGTDREFLFSSIKDYTISSVEELEKKFDRFRKAGYGQPLQKKYRLIIDLIYRESFASKM